MEEDVVLEIKVRLAGLSYADAKKMRDALRTAGDISMIAIADELVALAKEQAPQADVTVHAPWAEWRPASAKTRRGKKINSDQQD